MKKRFSLLFVLFIIALSFSSVSFGAKLESGTKTTIVGQTDFYVKHDANRVYWGGGFTVNEKLSDDIYKLMIGFYDNGRFVAVDYIPVDEMIESFEFTEQCIRLSYEPENLTAKAFAVSNDWNMIPLSEAVEAKPVAFNTYYARGRITDVTQAAEGIVSFQIEYSENFDGEIGVYTGKPDRYGEVTTCTIEAYYSDEKILDYLLMVMDVQVGINEEGNWEIVSYKVNNEEVALMSLDPTPYFGFYGVENNLNLVCRDGKVYVAGNIDTEVSGNAIYDMRVKVKNGESVVWNKDISISSKIDKFTLNEFINVPVSDYLYMEVDFIHNNSMLIETQTKEQTDGYTTVMGRFVDLDMVNNLASFQIEYAEDFEGEEISRGDTLTIELDLGDVNVEGKICEYAEIKLDVTQNGYKLVSYKTAPQNKIVTLPASLCRSYYMGEYIEFYNSETSSEYTEYGLDEDVRVYVNGMEVYYRDAEYALEKYVERNPTTVVRLVNTPRVGYKTVDSRYDYIMLDVETSAMVDEVIINKDKAVIYIDCQNSEILDTAEIELDLEEGKYLFYDTEGNKMSLEDLKQWDVITMYADFESSDPFSYYARFTVSRNVVTGRVMQEDPENEKYKIGDTYYGFAHDPEQLVVGDYYTIHLDKYGRIVYYEKSVVDVNYGIINRVWENNDGEKVIRLITMDGEIKTFEFNHSADYAEWQNEFEKYSDMAFTDTVKGNSYYSEEMLIPVYEKFIVSYKINGKGYIYAIRNVEEDNFKCVEGEYSENNKKISSAKMSDKTKILNFCNAAYDWSANVSGRIWTMTTDKFTDGECYKVIYGGQRFTDGTYPVVIVLEGEAAISTSQSPAVVTWTGNAVNPDDGIEYYAIGCLEDGKEKILYLEDDYWQDEVAVGDMIVYEINPIYNLVEDVVVLHNTQNAISLSEIESYTDNKYAEKNSDYSTLMYFKESGVDSWDYLERTERFARVGFGALIEKSQFDITVGRVEDGTTYVYDEIDFSDNVNVYIYDCSKPANNRISVGTTEDLKATQIPKVYYETESDSIYQWKAAGKEAVNSVFFKTFEDEITDILLIKPAATKDMSVYEGTGLVESVETENGIVHICLDCAYGDLESVYEIYGENKKYSVKDVNGNHLQLSDIKAGDVITVKVNGAVNEITVSNDVIKGSVENLKTNADGSFGYSVNGRLITTYDELDLGAVYTLHLNSESVAVKYVRDMSDINYGVINRVWEDTDGFKVIRIVTMDGEVLKYKFLKNSDYESWLSIYNEASDSDSLSDVYDKMVVSYKINESGYIFNIKNELSSMVMGEYNYKAQKISSAKMSDTTKILDFTEANGMWNESISRRVYKDSIENFVEEESYRVIYGGAKNADCTYPFVIVLEGVAGIHTKKPFAIVKNTGRMVNKADDIVYAGATVIENGEEKVIFFEDDEIDIRRGDVIVYSLNREGLVEDGECVVLYSADLSIWLDDVERFSRDRYADKNADFATSLYFEKSGVDSWDDLSRTNNYARVGYGVLVDKYENSIVVGKVEDGMTLFYDEIDLADSVNVYLYDQGKIASERITVGTVADLTPTKIPKNFYETDNENVYQWERAGFEAVKTVYFKTLEDNITDIIVIIP